MIAASVVKELIIPKLFSLQFLDTLIQSLIDRLSLTKHSSKKEDYEEAVAVAKRFVHAVVRVYVVLSACTSPAAIKRKGYGIWKY